MLAGSQNKTATLRDLDEHLSIQDLYDLLEVGMIEAHNAKKMREAAENKR